MMECDERRDGDGCGLAKGEKVLKGETRGAAGRMGTISRPDHPPLALLASRLPLGDLFRGHQVHPELWCC